eukprot:Clim_evm8s164 gene=Clim_evmTU8s164
MNTVTHTSSLVRASSAAMLAKTSTLGGLFISIRNKKKAAAKPTAAASKTAAVEEDAEEQLIDRYRGINYFVEGKDPEVKANSEYPDWLWQCTEPRPAAQPHERRFWKDLRKQTIRQQNEDRKSRYGKVNLD